MTLRPVGSPISAGGVADQEDDRVPELLEVPQLADQHGVAQVQVRRGGIEAALMRMGTPDARDCAMRSRSASSGMISAAPLVIRSSCSSTAANVAISLKYEELPGFIILQATCTA